MRELKISNGKNVKNVEFWKKHQNTPYVDSQKMLKKTHKEVMKLIETFSNDDFFQKNILTGRERLRWEVLRFRNFQPLRLGIKDIKKA